METKTDIVVKLIGTDGNIFNLMALVNRALRRNGRGDLVAEFTKAVTSSGSYDEALCVIMDYVIVE